MPVLETAQAFLKQKARYLDFYSDNIYMYNYSCCYANSVRLVKNIHDI